MRVLIVDDSELARMILIHCFDEDITCDEAHDGIEAFDMFTGAWVAGHPYDLVFMDIIMPNMDGKAALRKIRKYEEGAGMRRTPVCMMSASEMIDDVADLADSFARKPITRQVIDNIVANIQPVNA